MGFRRFGQPIPRFGEALGQSNPLNLDYASMIANVSPGNLIGYWPLNEISGTVATDHSATGASGAYVAPVTLGQPGMGNGNFAPNFSGGRVSLTATLAAINTAIGDKSKGTMAIWCKVPNAATWTDSTIRAAFEIGADVNNRVLIQKSSTSNRIVLSHFGGGTEKDVFINSFSPLTWFHIAISWDKAANEVRGYLNSAQQGVTIAGMGTWVGALTASWSAIGDFSSAGSLPWAGLLAHCGLWKVALTPAQIASLYVPAWAA